MARIWIIVAAIALFAAPSITSAHPGHSEDGASTSLLHYVSQPVHLLGVLAGAIVIVAAVTWAQRVRRARVRA